MGLLGAEVASTMEGTWQDEEGTIRTLTVSTKQSFMKRRMKADLSTPPAVCGLKRKLISVEFVEESCDRTNLRGRLH